MAPRTNTTLQSSFDLPMGGTLSFPVPSSPTSHTSAYLRSGSSFDSGLHWHEGYTEYFRVFQGVLRVTLESPSGALVTSFIGPGSGIIEVQRFRRHRLRRGDEGKGWKSWMEGVEYKEGGKIPKDEWEKDVRAEEWTSPADGRKEAFFRNLCGAILEPKKGGLWTAWEGLCVVLSAFAVMREFDNWPAFLGGRFKTLEWAVSHIILGFMSWIASLVGLKGEWDEYTPKEIRKPKDGRKDL